MSNFRYDPLSMVEKNLSELQERIYQQKNDLKAILEEFNKLAMLVANEREKPLYRQKNRIIVRIMNHFIEKGLSVNDAIILTSSRTGEDIRRIEVVYHLENQEKKIMEKQAKILMIRRLNALHYPKKEIARVTGYSEKYIFEIMKRNNIKTR